MKKSIFWIPIIGLYFVWKSEYGNTSMVTLREYIYATFLAIFHGVFLSMTLYYTLIPLINNKF